MVKHNDYYFICYWYFETNVMKTLSSSLEEKADQDVPRWIEPKVCHYFFKSALELLPCVTFVVVALVNIFHIAFRVMFKPEAECGYYVMHWMW